MSITKRQQRKYYDALVRKDPAYVGVFYAGVKTTGIFCHSICPARKPKFENCEFFHIAEEALLASYRPCKRCHPLSPPQATTKTIQLLIDAVEANPERRWKDADFKKIGVDESTVRRQFKKRFGMTFVQYARARRMGIAMKEIRKGGSIINAQLSTGYESGSGFRDAFLRVIGTTPRSNSTNNLFASWLDTKLGPMIAIADERALILLEFVNRRGLENEILRLRDKTQSTIIPGDSNPIRQIRNELTGYFDGMQSTFKTPVNFIGTPFQKAVWRELLKIPAGQTSTYTDIAKKIRKSNATRAVGQANSKNQLAIIVPCHRVIKNDRTVGGYGGGVARKKWLLEHEEKMD